MVNLTPQQIQKRVDRRKKIEALKPLCGTVVMSVSLRQALKKAVTTRKVLLEQIVIFVRSDDPADGLSNRQLRRSCTRYELGPCYVSKITGLGVTKVRFDEIGTDRFVVISLVAQNKRWRVCASADKARSGRRAGSRMIGFNPQLQMA